MKDFSKLEKQLDINFKNKDLLLQAFCHRSYLNENPSFHLGHNERLEFLGDAVLELVVTDYLYTHYPNKTEGELTSWRAALVNAKILFRIAEEINFNEFLLLSRGEEKELGKSRQYILANAFEAFIGAIYLDQGYQESYKLIERILVKELSHIIKSGLYIDAKSSFQEKAQEKVSITPAYEVLKETGLDHARNFTVGVFLGKELIAEGNGSSKQEAEIEAAKNALESKNWS